MTATPNGNPPQRPPVRLGRVSYRSLALAVFATLGVLGGLLAASPARSASTDTTVTIPPDADSYVRSDQATTNFGSSTQLVSCASPCGTGGGTMVSYLRFSVSGLSGALTSARLALFSESSGVTRTQVYAVSDTTWGETSINYSNRPALGRSLGYTGALTAQTWISADVTSAVTGNGSYTFALTTTATAIRVADSREAGSGKAPQLQITSTSATSTPPPSTTASSTSPPPSTTASSSPPTTSSTPPPPSAPVIALGGDIACAPADPNYNRGNGVPGYCHMKVTADLNKSLLPDAVLALGDEQYNSGNLNDFKVSYDASWGQVKGITKPTVGNHEYGTSGAGGYFTYFGPLASGGSSCTSGCGGYYSFDLGTWHIVSINTECTRINGSAGCAVGSPQEQWLEADLAAHPNECTLVFGHRPRWSSNSFANSDIGPLITDMYKAGVDVYASGHSHSYERFRPQSDTGASDPNGITQIIVGTGGSFFTGFGTVVANSDNHKSNIFGVLKMTLEPGGWDWTFIADSSTPWTDSVGAGRLGGTCH